MCLCVVCSLTEYDFAAVSLSESQLMINLSPTAIYGLISVGKRRHERTHDGSNVVQCSICGKTFRRRHRLNVHLVAKHAGLGGSTTDLTVAKPTAPVATSPVFPPVTPKADVKTGVPEAAANVNGLVKPERPATPGTTPSARSIPMKPTPESVFGLSAVAPPPGMFLPPPVAALPPPGLNPLGIDLSQVFPPNPQSALQGTRASVFKTETSLAAVVESRRMSDSTDSTQSTDSSSEADEGKIGVGPAQSFQRPSPPVLRRRRRAQLELMQSENEGKMKASLKKEEAVPNGSNGESGEQQAHSEENHQAEGSHQATRHVRKGMQTSLNPKTDNPENTASAQETTNTQIADGSDKTRAFQETVQIESRTQHTQQSTTHVQEITAETTNGSSTRVNNHVVPHASSDQKSNANDIATNSPPTAKASDTDTSNENGQQEES